MKVINFNVSFTKRKVEIKARGFENFDDYLKHLNFMFNDCLYYDNDLNVYFIKIGTIVFYVNNFVEFVEKLYNQRVYEVGLVDIENIDNYEKVNYN